jgi:hypothetical protein
MTAREETPMSDRPTRGDDSSGHGDSRATITTLAELARRLSDHPDVSAALEMAERSAGSAKPPGRRSSTHDDPAVPALLRKAIARDGRVSDVAKATRHVMDYYREASGLLAERAKGRPRAAKDDRAFVKKWSGIEADYHKMVGGACMLARTNPALMASAKVVAESPQDLDTFANPVFLDNEAMAVARHLGLRPAEMDLYYEYAYLPSRHRTAKAMASENLGEALRAVEENASHVEFELSPKRLVEGGRVAVGGDFFFLASFFAQVFAVVTTIVAVVAVATVVAAAAALVVAAAAVVQATVAVLENAGEWLSDQFDKARDFIDRLEVTEEEEEKEEWKKWFALYLLGPVCNAQCPPTGLVPSVAASSLQIERDLIRYTNQPGDRVRIRVVVRDANGCCVPNADLDIQAGLAPLFSGTLVYTSLAVIPRTTGVYDAIWGPAAFQGGYRTLWIRYLLGGAPGQEGRIQVWPNGTSLLTQMQDFRAGPEWASATAGRTPEQAVELYGYALGNMSRSKLELHLPDCSFLYLTAPRNLRRFATLDEGRSVGLDNCFYCVGGSKR